MKEKRIKPTKFEFLFTKGPKGPKGQHTRLTGSIVKVNGRLRSTLSYQNLTQRQLSKLESCFEEMVLYVIEHGDSVLDDQYSELWIMDKECFTYYMIRVEWIK